MSLPDFTHVVVVVFENHEATAIVGNPDAPTFNALGRQYARLTRYYGVTHPSLPNYLALVSGSTHGITNDCTDCVVAARNLADTLAAAGKTWKTYAEDLPVAGIHRRILGRLREKARPVPLLPQRRRLECAAQSRRAVHPARAGSRRAQAPCLLARRPEPLQRHARLLASRPATRGSRRTSCRSCRRPQLRGGVVFVVFDEGTTGDGGGGHVDALALGPSVRPGSVFARTTNHYGLLRTIEDAWHLPRLGLSAKATPIGGIWKG